jgi:hypothetical protein
MISAVRGKACVHRPPNIATALLVCLLAACGGGDEPGSPLTPGSQPPPAAQSTLSIGETSLVPCGRPDPGIGRRAIIGLRAVVTPDGQGLIARTTGQSGGDLELRLDRNAVAGAFVEATGTLRGAGTNLNPFLTMQRIDASAASGDAAASVEGTLQGGIGFIGTASGKFVLTDWDGTSVTCANVAVLLGPLS